MKLRLASLALTVLLVGTCFGQPREAILYTFSGVQDGIGPDGGLAFDSTGHLYGTTGAGGTGICVQGCGTVFRLTRTATGWTEDVLHSFSFDSGGESPELGVLP